MTENEKKQRQRIKAKEKCVKILNICCYISTAILILLLVLAGCQNCGGKSASGVSAESPIQVENLARTQWHFNDVLDETSLEHYDQESWQVAFTTQAGTQYTYIYIDDYTMRYQNPNSEPYWCYTAEYGWDGISGQTITFFGEYTYLNYDNEDLINFLQVNAKLVNPLTTFTFNEAYNYNAPLGLNVGITGLPFLNDLSWVNTSDIVAPSTKTETTAKLYVVPFYSNGRLYNAIQSTYVIARSNNALYTEDKEGAVQQVSSGLPVFAYMSYAYIENDNVAYSDVVNIRNTTQAVYENNNVLVYQEATTWVNDVYRYLNFSGYVITGDLATRLKAYNNNNELVIYTNTDEYTSVFTLLGHVFTSIAPILSLTILPGLTIGIIMFIPLVVAVIFFIIKIIKK